MAEIGEIVNFLVRGSGDGAEELKATIAFGSEQAKARGERFKVKEWLTNFYANIRERVEERNTAQGGGLTSKQLDQVALKYLRNGVKYSSTEEGRALMKERGVDGATDFLIEKGYADVPGIATLAEAEVVEAESAPARPSRAGETSWGRMRQTPARDMTTIEEVETVETEGMADTVPYSGSMSDTLSALSNARSPTSEQMAIAGSTTATMPQPDGVTRRDSITPGWEHPGRLSRGPNGGLMADRPDEVTVDWLSEGPNAANKEAPFEGTETEIERLLRGGARTLEFVPGRDSTDTKTLEFVPGRDKSELVPLGDPSTRSFLVPGDPGWAEGVRAEGTPAATGGLGGSLGDLATMAGGDEGGDTGMPLDEALGHPPDAGLLGTGTQGEGAPPSQGMSGMSLASGIIGGVGIAGAISNTITDFRTTAALEDMLADSAAGNTVAREEGRIAGGRLQRNIMGSSLGRRDISPALALRNAQMATAPALSDAYAQAAVESARERRQSETQLAQLRKKRYDDLFGSLMQTAGTVGSLLATQGANKETEARARRSEAANRTGLQDVTGGRGARPPMLRRPKVG